ncbi:hypothetical protein GM415_06185 [Pseudodesulfovibrio cashew]|uniref:Uncharacterized protein n=1 Tax=Pseudodesulfovibrio cashew TaxID=2678688 RepID=A0A6I6JH88_9BACT|nr:hypothetical protein [Pseudodesulfovibrio cashew]QGY39722.1 hypothetical protein GM415_06185 [Pseudodesulfovibrio cashew]
MTRKFDPELLYVECSRCGQPVLWQYGTTTKLLNLAGIDPASLDERCVIMSEGCPGCTPDKSSFTTQVIRLNKEKEGRRPMPATAN